MSRANFSVLDLVAFFLVFGFTLAAVAYGRKKLKKGYPESKLELLLMGRTITLPLFIASLVASWYGGITGVAALTYEKGLFSFLTQGLFWYAAYLIFALVLIPRIPKNGAETFPELVGNHLGPRAHRVTAILNMTSLLPIAYVLSLGILIQFLTGWSLFAASSVGLIFIFSYSLTSGLRAVVFADSVQFLAILAAVISVAAFAVFHYGTPDTHWAALLPPQHLALSGGQRFSEIFVWGFIAIATLVDPLFYQRALAAKSKKQAMQGVLGATVIWFIFDCSMTIGALYARAYMPNLNPSDSYLVFSTSILPHGVRGFFMAGLFSADISVLDASLFSASSIFAYDILNPGAFNKRRLRLSMIGVGLCSLLITPFFQGNIALVWKVMGSLSSSCLLFPWILMMIFPKYKSERRFLASVCCGLLFMVIGGVLIYFQKTDLDCFYFGLSGSAIGFVLACVAQVVGFK